MASRSVAILGDNLPGLPVTAVGLANGTATSSPDRRSFETGAILELVRLGSTGLTIRFGQASEPVRHPLRAKVVPEPDLCRLAVFDFLTNWALCHQIERSRQTGLTAEFQRSSGRFDLNRGYRTKDRSESYSGNFFYQSDAYDALPWRSGLNQKMQRSRRRRSNPLPTQPGRCA